MRAENKLPKHRIGPIKGFRSVALEMLRLGAFIGKHCGFTIDSDEIRRAESTPDGLRLKLKGTAGTGNAALGLDVSDTGIVTPATVGGAMPTIGGTALDAGTPPTLTIPGSGTRYVVLNITSTFSTSTLGGQVFVGAGLSGISVTVTLDTSAPGSAGLQSTTGAFKIHLATFVNGSRTAQLGHGPISLAVQDNLDGSGKGNLIVTWA